MSTTILPNSKPIVFEDDKLIRFHHCDPAGIIFYPQYFVLFNELIEDWFTRGLGISFVDQVTKERVSTPIGRVECDFVSASKIGDVPRFRLAVAAEDDKTSPIYGMPVLQVWKAGTVMFIKLAGLGLCRHRQSAVLPRQHHDAARRRQEGDREHRQGDVGGFDSGAHLTGANNSSGGCCKLLQEGQIYQGGNPSIRSTCVCRFEQRCQALWVRNSWPALP